MRTARAVILYLALLPVLAGLFTGAAGLCRRTSFDLVKGENFVSLEIGGNPQRIFHPDGYVRLADMPRPLIQALLYQEDRGFYGHRGYRLREMFLSVGDYLYRGRPRGASTITQQLARTLFLGREKTLRRKINEMRLARLIEKRFTKDEILELYLNHVYWGDNTNGIYATSLRRMHKKPQALSPRECAFLVSLLPAPDACPTVGVCDVRATRRYNHILSRFESEWKSPDKAQRK